MRTVVEESQCTATRCGIVDYFGNHRLVVAEIEFVADSDFTGGLHKNVPQLILCIQFAKQKNFYPRTCFFLVSIEESWKNLGVVEHHHVAVVEIVDDVLEDMVRNLAGLSVHHHQAAFVAFGHRMCGNLLFGKMKFKLR